MIKSKHLDEIQKIIDDLLIKNGITITTRQLSDSILQLSDSYIQKPGDHSKIWRNERLAGAYLNYFLPLNYLRLLPVFQEAATLGFFSDISRIVDFGSGPGTAQLAALESNIHFENWLCIEKDRSATDWHKKIIKKLSAQKQTSQKTQFQLEHNNDFTHGNSTAVIFSYSLNEVNELPNWALKANALFIVEPSSQNQSRKLQELRSKLLAHNYYAWAPCTHQLKCPLLIHSKTDWCHNRIAFQLPERVQKIETTLPIKNSTLTYSYLLMKKSPPLINSKSFARVIGDTLNERGKIRQAVCRGEKREFLSWLTREGAPEQLQRGSLFEIPDGARELENEIRLTKKEPRE